VLQRSEAYSGVRNPSRSSSDGCSARPGLEPSPALAWRRRGWRTSRPTALVAGVGRGGGGVGAGEGADLAWLLQHCCRAGELGAGARSPAGPSASHGARLVPGTGSSWRFCCGREARSTRRIPPGSRSACLLCCRLVRCARARRGDLPREGGEVPWSSSTRPLLRLHGAPPCRGKMRPPPPDPANLRQGS
jgi:hypothetical protein